MGAVTSPLLDSLFAPARLFLDGMIKEKALPGEVPGRAFHFLFGACELISRTSPLSYSYSPAFTTKPIPMRTWLVAHAPGTVTPSTVVLPTCMGVQSN